MPSISARTAARSGFDGAASGLVAAFGREVFEVAPRGRGPLAVAVTRRRLVREVRTQPEITYGLNCFDQFSMLPRRDGIVVQSQPPGDYNNSDVTVDRAEAENSVRMLADVVARMH